MSALAPLLAREPHGPNICKIRKGQTRSNQDLNPRRLALCQVLPFTAIVSDIHPNNDFVMFIHRSHLLIMLLSHTLILACASGHTNCIFYDKMLSFTVCIVACNGTLLQHKQPQTNPIMLLRCYFDL